MPKTKVELLRKWTKPYSSLYIKDDFIFCSVCSKMINSEKKFLVDQHVKTSAHLKNSIYTVKQENVNTFMDESSENATTTELETFRNDLCHMLVACNIPLKTLDNSLFTNFLNKYCEHDIPSESLMKKYLSINFLETQWKIKNIIGNHYLWFSVDETTDEIGRYVANLVVGVLNEDSVSKSYLVSVKVLDKTNNATISRFVNESFSALFLPDSVPFEKIVLMLTDDAKYMITAASNLKIFYPNLIHVTCMAHGINRVTEKIREEFPEVNSLINNVKKVFLKAPLRIQVYRDHLPNIPLPPESVMTRWGTWLEACMFYAENYESIEMIVSCFNTDDCLAIENCKNLFKSKELKNQLVFITTNFSNITVALKKIENSTLTLTESLSIVTNLQEKLNEVSGAVGRNISKKMSDVLKNNPGYDEISNIKLILDGNFEIKCELPSVAITKFKFAPITSCNVERSFSAYKYILNDQRHNFSMESIEKHLIIYCFQNNSK